MLTGTMVTSSYNLQPTEVNIVGDSIDLEMRITEDSRHVSTV